MEEEWEGKGLWEGEEGEETLFADQAQSSRCTGFGTQPGQRVEHRWGHQPPEGRAQWGNPGRNQVSCSEQWQQVGNVPPEPSIQLTSPVTCELLPAGQAGQCRRLASDDQNVRSSLSRQHMLPPVILEVREHPVNQTCARTTRPVVETDQSTLLPTECIVHRPQQQHQMASVNQWNMESRPQEQRMSGETLDMSRVQEAQRTTEMGAVVPSVEAHPANVQAIEHMLSQARPQVRFPWWGTVETAKAISVALSPVEARLKRRNREIGLSKGDNQDIEGRLQTVEAALGSLGSIQDPTAFANLILRMRRELGLGVERLHMLDGRHAKLAQMVELDEGELVKARSGVNDLLQRGGVLPARQEDTR